MYRFFLLAIALVMTGCTSYYPTVANLNLQIVSQPPVYGDAKISIEGKDLRQAKEIIVYQLKDQMPIAVDNMSPPEILLAERLAGGLKEQGVQLVSRSETRLFLEINELLVTVTRPKFLYSTEARSRVTLTIVKDASSLAKKYERQATKESPGRPELPQLEQMLNEQLSDIVSQMLQDEDIRQAISTR